MKRIFFVMLFILLVGLIAFYSISNQETEDFSEFKLTSNESSSLKDEGLRNSNDNKEEVDNIVKIENKKIQAKAKKQDEQNNNENTFQTTPDERAIPDDELTAMNEKFQKVELEWENKMRDLIFNEFDLDQKAFDEYVALKEGFQRDKIEAFEEYHQFMQEKYGENYSYQPTDDEIAFSVKINEEYLLNMKKLFGEERYLRYLEFRDQYNNHLKETLNPEVGIILMEL